MIRGVRRGICIEFWCAVCGVGGRVVVVVVVVGLGVLLGFECGGVVSKHRVLV